MDFFLITQLSWTNSAKILSLTLLNLMLVEIVCKTLVNTDESEKSGDPSFSKLALMLGFLCKSDHVLGSLSSWPGFDKAQVGLRPLELTRLKC